MSQETALHSSPAQDRSTGSGLSLSAVTLVLGDGDQQVRALDAVDLHVARREFAAIVGPSGSGKSSLLAVAGSLSQPDSGQVRLDEHELTALSSKAQARHRLQEVGFVFQSGNLIPSLTSADQLRFVNRLSGGPKDFDPLPLLASVGMEHRAQHRPGQLSGGERQRVGIARALVTRPSLMLLDEPTAALDSARSHEVISLLADRTHALNIATIVVTHDLGMLDMCDSVYEMRDGRLARQR